MKLDELILEDITEYNTSSETVSITITDANYIPETAFDIIFNTYMYNTLTYNKRNTNILYDIYTSQNVELYNQGNEVYYFIRVQSNANSQMFFHLTGKLKRVIPNNDWTTIEVINNAQLKVKEIFNSHVSNNKGITQIKYQDNTALYQSVDISENTLSGWSGNLTEEVVLSETNYEIYNSSINNVDIDIIYDSNNNIMGSLIDLQNNEDSVDALQFINNTVMLNINDHNTIVNNNSEEEYINEALNFIFNTHYNENDTTNEVILNTNNIIIKKKTTGAYSVNIKK